MRRKESSAICNTTEMASMDLTDHLIWRPKKHMDSRNDHSAWTEKESVAQRAQWLAQVSTSKNKKAQELGHEPKSDGIKVWISLVRNMFAQLGFVGEATCLRPLGEGTDPWFPHESIPSYREPVRTHFEVWPWQAQSPCSLGQNSERFLPYEDLCP